MNIENLKLLPPADPSKTSCEYSRECTLLKICYVMDNFIQQVDTSSRLATNRSQILNPDSRVKEVRWTKEIAEGVLKTHIRYAGDCPNASKIENNGKELIKSRFNS